MKCPKCGFVSYAGLAQCKKCGYPFTKAAPKRSSVSLTSLIPEGVQSTPSAPPGTPPAHRGSPPSPEPEIFTPPAPPSEMAPVRASSSPEDLPTGNRTPVDEETQAWIKELSERVENYRSEPGRAPAEAPPEDWREELSERLENFRKRRARLQPEADPPGNLELDFEGSGHPVVDPFIDDTMGSPGSTGADFDLEIGERVITHRNVDRPPEILPRDESAGEARHFEAGSLDAGEMTLGEPLAKSPPMEIVVGSPSESRDGEKGEETEGIYIAPLGRRFLAGLTDALVLILAAALFGVIFWRFCGRLSLVPLNIAVMGSIGVIFTFAYFAVFTAIASATPGLLWVGCEIRNLRGEHPTVRESFWRAFGILVSLSAFMLGFIWALVDSGSLTWHDRMSGTVITEENSASDLAGLKVEI